MACDILLHCNENKNELHYKNMNMSFDKKIL